MRLCAAALLLLGCTRPAPPPSAPRPDLTLKGARVRSWNAEGLQLDARAPTLEVMKGSNALAAQDATVTMPRSGATVTAPRLEGDLAGSHFEAPAGAALTTASGLTGSAPKASYQREGDGGVFSGHDGVALAQPDAGFALEAKAFRFETASRKAQFDQVETTAGAPP